MTDPTITQTWPRLGLGCAALAQPGVAAQQQAHAVIEMAWESGIRLFDVAPLYGGGLSEEYLGSALQGVPRDQYRLFTKTGVTRPYGQGPVPRQHTLRRSADVWDYSDAATRRSVETSLQRLHTDRLDLVHLHDIEGHEAASLQAYATLSDLQSQRMIGGISVGSNHVDAPTWLMNQVSLDAMLVAGRYTLLDATAGDLFSGAAQRGVKVIAAGVLNSGVLAGGDRAHALFHYQPVPANVMQRVSEIAAVCRLHQIPMMAAAVQFVVSHPAIATVLLGPRSVEELQGLLAMVALPIPEMFWQQLASMGIRRYADPCHGD